MIPVSRVSGSTQYQLSGYVWVSSFTGGNIYLDLNDGNGEGDSFIDAHAVANTSLTGQWQQITASFTTSPGTTGVTIRIVHDGGGSTTFFLDQVSIRAVNPQNGANTGRIQKVNDHLDESWSQSYGYDAFGRLTQATSSAWGLQWSYDRYGNLLGQTATGGTPPRYTVSADPNSNRVISRTDLATSQTQYWTYDAAGNVTYDGRYSYVWDAENRLIQVKQGANVISQYQYDAFGARVIKAAGATTTYYYFGVAEVENLAVWSKIHVVAFGEKLVEYANGTTNFYAANHLGSVAAVMDKDGNVTSDMRFYPFGERIIGDTTQRHQFTGQERDGETGNDYFGARHYWSGGGRWLSMDPVRGDMSNPQRLNRYGYVLNDPINFFDPDGAKEWPTLIRNPSPRGPGWVPGTSDWSPGGPDSSFLLGASLASFARPRATPQSPSEAEGIRTGDVAFFTPAFTGYNALGQTEDDAQHQLERRQSPGHAFFQSDVFCRQGADVWDLCWDRRREPRGVGDVAFFTPAKSVVETRVAGGRASQQARGEEQGTQRFSLSARKQPTAKASTFFGGKRQAENREQGT